MTDKTTTEQLAEIDRDMADIDRQVAELVEEAQQADYKTQELPEYTPPEGWRVLQSGELLQPGDHWVNWEGTVSRPDIQHGDGATVSGGRYIRWVKPQPQPEPQPNAAAIEELRSEVSYVQRLLGTERRRVAELEELVTSLRTINRGCENAVRDAGKENFALRNQLEAVKAELVTQAETSRRLQIELDAAQQVPQAIADRFEEGWNQGTARAIETIIAWLEPIRLADSAYLANATMQHLPSIMRHLTGLTQD